MPPNVKAERNDSNKSGKGDHATISPADMARIEAAPEKVRKLQKDLSGIISRGDMTRLINDRPKGMIEEIAKKQHTTVEIVNQTLDFIAFLRTLRGTNPTRR